MEPIKPEEIVSAKTKSVPKEVIQAFNDLIGKHWNGHSSKFKQEEVVNRILGLMPEGTTSRELFDNHHLDVEDIYREQGWTVKYDKPGYNETYSPTFEFTIKKKCDCRG